MRQQQGGVQTLSDLLPEAAAAFSHRIAVIGTERTFTFDEANRSARAVAATFGEIDPGQHVVLSMHKTSDSFIIIHALLSIGAVVVPVDPLMPVLGAVALIEAVAPVAVVVDQTSMERLDLFGGDVGGFAVFCVDGDDERATSLRRPIDDPESCAQLHDRPTVAPGDPAYVIFTSGSTGIPKGITHTHGSALAYASLAVDAHGITADDRLAGLPPLHFDMSTLELYSAPLAGAAIVPIGTAELRFPASFTERAEQLGITLWYSVPFQLRQISERGALDQRDMSLLRHVIYAGEAFSAPALAALMHQLPGARFSNAYGPAETNVVTVYELSASPVDVVPIGRPWGDVEVRIIDRDAEITSADDLSAVADVAPGELGELWVLAASVMVGYLHAPELTSERCVKTDRGTWYRTGDLVSSSDGLLRLAGRVDHQVKVRGVRLELEAVEAVLGSHPDIAEAVVAPVGGAASVEQLVAAVVLAPSAPVLDRVSLRRWCLERLVQVAVPTDIAAWNEFPLTSSGKIDRANVRTVLAQPGGATPPMASGSLTNGSSDA